MVNHNLDMQIQNLQPKIKRTKNFKKPYYGFLNKNMKLKAATRMR